MKLLFLYNLLQSARISKKFPFFLIPLIFTRYQEVKNIICQRGLTNFLFILVALQIFTNSSFEKYSFKKSCFNNNSRKKLIFFGIHSYIGTVKPFFFFQKNYNFVYLNLKTSLCKIYLHHYKFSLYH